MTVWAYVLIQSDPATARAVKNGVHRLAVADTKVLSAETVTGPFDIIVLVESPDLDGLGHAVTEGIQRLPGVKGTTTCLAIELA